MTPHFIPHLCYILLQQLLRLHEHMVTAASQGVLILIQTFGDKFVLTEIIREISRMGRNNTGKDASAAGMRNFTQFLTEVSSSCPQMIVPSLSLLMSFLDEEVSSISKNLLLMGYLVIVVLESVSDQAGYMWSLFCS